MNAMRLAAGLLGGASAIALVSAANAQTAPAAASSEIVVTGSRVITNGNNSPTPVTVVTVQDMQVVQPATISDNLNSLPVFSGSRNEFGNPSASPQGGNGSGNQLNLRNLGANRNLILFDGHRVPSTLSDGTVDSDMIPQLLIQRVDLVTGGVSAVYGSDAVSGVVNFITDTKFNGLKLQGQAGISQYSDDQTLEFGLVYGTKLLDGRAHFEGSYEYRNDAGVLHRTDRPWDQQVSVVGAGTAAAPYFLTSGVRMNKYTFGGLITNGVLSGQTFKTDGTLSPFIHGAPSGTSTLEIGGDGAYANTSMKAPQNSHQFFGRFDYDFSDTVHGYVDFSGDIKRNIQYTGSAQLQTVQLNAQDGFLSPTYQAQLAAAKQTTFALSEIMTYDAPRQSPEADAQQFFVNAGLNGNLGGYKWDLSYVHSWARQLTTLRNNINTDKLAAVLDAVVNPANGQIVCNVTLTNPGLYSGCTPLNPFGPTAANPAAVNYFLGNTHATALTTQDDIEGSVAGAPFSTWAGPVSVALSGEWRRRAFSQTSDATPSQLVDCTGLRYNCSAGTALWQNTFAPSATVSQDVWETAGEFDAPLLKDLPFVQAFNLNGAARYTSYSTSGDYVTWKIGGDWHVDESLTLRATQSRDIRAPSLADLYAPLARETSGSTDLLTNLAPTVPLLSGGNPNLTAEIGSTTTAGLVWRPKFIDGLSLAVDGYHVTITNAISNVLGFNTLVQKACYASGGSSPFCQLQPRPLGYTNTSPANAVTAWYSEEINIAKVETYGLDVEANYSTKLFDRPFSARVLMNYQPHLIFTTPGLSVLDHAGVVYSTNSLYPAARISATGFVHYKVTDDFTVDVMERWRAPMTMKDQATQVWVNPTVASFYTTNLTVTYSAPPTTPSGHLDVFLSIQNLFNANPPPAGFYSSQGPGSFGGWAIGDDPVGRYFTLGARFKY